MSTWIPLKIADLALDEKDKEIAALKAEVERLKADNEQLQNRCDFLEGKQS